MATTGFLLVLGGCYAWAIGRARGLSLEMLGVFVALIVLPALASWSGLI